MIRKNERRKGWKPGHRREGSETPDSHPPSSVPSGLPGEIVAVDEEGIAVAAAGGAVRIGKVRTEKGKQGAAAFAAEAKIRPGERFTAA